MIPVPELTAYFAGEWRLSRRILDRRARQSGKLTGQAHFTAHLGGLGYTETGEMIFGAYQGQSSQNYQWNLIDGGRATVHFRDGRVFHALDLRSGIANVEHLCAADHYRGRYRILATDSWRMVWRVIGPRKDLIITNRFRRSDKGRLA